MEWPSSWPDKDIFINSDDQLGSSSLMRKKKNPRAEIL